MKKALLGLLLIGLLAMVACEIQPPAEITTKTPETGDKVTPAGDAVKVGFIGPLSGDAAAYGISAKRGAELAYQELGASNLKLIIEDTKCEGKEAVSAVNKLISVDGVQAIIGELCSGATLAAAPVAMDKKVVLISPASTSPKLSEAGDYIFRTVPSDAFQGLFGAQLVSSRNHQKLAIMYSNEDYGIGFKNVLKSSFAGKIVTSQAFERGATDIRTQLTKVKSAQPDAIYIISNSPDAAVATLKQIKELGIEAAIFGSEGLKSQDILDVAGEAAEGLTVTSVSFGNQEFTDAHTKMYGEPPGPFAAQAYDALMAIKTAVDQGATTGTDIKDALATIEFKGASGSIFFDEHGDVEANFDIFQVKEGKFIQVFE